MADTLRTGISQQLSDSIVKALESGVLVTIVGDIDKLGATDTLKQLMGVERGLLQTTYDIRGTGVLRGLDGISGATSMLAFDLFRKGSSAGETVLTSSRGATIGVSQVVGSSMRPGRLNVLSIKLDTTRLRILGNIEKTLCENISSSEAYDREICRR